MMLLGDKKIISLILNETHVPKEKEVPQGLEGDFSKAHELIAKELIEAVKSGDPRMVSRSLKHFIQMCEKEEDYSAEEGE